ncbi:MAG: GGDEF domain-containing protein [Gammaproteobacteria bacterium]|nr:GGDEF domain-containing protein [Gammaproteobacteria bacterium]MCW8909810.1 GGDEF domain-containing protein [Gammaproteobacteria bacterium]MCW9005996.1 GGDEF domain-containing protein [Gammaproteobacteria bacterium]
MLRYIDSSLTELGARKSFFIALISSFFLGLGDYVIGPELSFSVFYTAPIMLATWYGGKREGLIIALVCAGIWLMADLAAGNDYSAWLIPVWNTLVRLAFFIIILWLLNTVHEKLLFEESLADTDALTGLANRRFFQEQLEREYARVQRYPEPITIAYFDLDNFKYVNDSMGHDVGDELLRSVAKTLLANIRVPDFAARLGGDEFAVLFPVLKKESALAVLEKLQAELLAVMAAKGWPVTFSIGVVTFSRAMESSRDMIRQVDGLMYEVKKSGKNNIRHLVWPG